MYTSVEGHIFGTDTLAKAARPRSPNCLASSPKLQCKASIMHADIMHACVHTYTYLPTYMHAVMSTCITKFIRPTSCTVESCIHKTYHLIQKTPYTLYYTSEYCY